MQQDGSAATQAASVQPAPFRVTEHVATCTEAPSVRRHIHDELAPVLESVVADDVAAALGELFIATCTPGHPVEVAVTVGDAAVTVEATCQVSEPPELDDLSHRLLTGIADVWGVEVQGGSARCWAQLPRI